MMKGMSLAATAALTVSLHAVPSLANGENFSRAGNRAHVAVTGDADGTVLAKMLKTKPFDKSGKSPPNAAQPNMTKTPTVGGPAPTPIPYRNRVGSKKRKVKSSGGSPASLKNKGKRTNYKNIGNSVGGQKGQAHPLKK